MIAFKLKKIRKRTIRLTLMRKMNDCFDKQLTAIYQQIVQLKQINQLVNKYLPKSLQAHCQVTRFNQGRLNIGVNEVSFATELRFFLPTLRDLLRQKGKLHQLTSLSISVVPSTLEHSTKKTPKKLSPAAYLAIHEASKSCRYKPLQQAWKHLLK